MGRFHISEDGQARPCSAQPGNCKLGNSEDEHYETAEEAQKAYESEMSNETQSVLKKVQSSDLSIEDYETFDSLREDYDPQKVNALQEDMEYAFSPKNPQDLRAAAYQRALKHHQSLRGSNWQPDRNLEFVRKTLSNNHHISSKLTPTKSGVIKTFAAQLKYSKTLTPPERLKGEYEAFSKKPTAANYNSLVEASRPIRNLQDPKEDHFVESIKSMDTDLKSSSKRKFYTLESPTNTVMNRENEAEFDLEYPKTPKQYNEYKVTDYSGELPEGVSEPGGYGVRRVDKSKSGPNGSPMGVMHTQDGWVTSTSAGIALRGPFKDVDKAVECVQAKEMRPSQPLYYD